MRSATTKRSVGGLVAFGIGTVGALVLAVGLLVLGGGKGDQRIFPTAVASAGGSAVAGGGGNDKPAPAGEGEINVVEKDFAIAMDKATVKAGPITFNLKNNGPSPHNIAIKELNQTSETIDGGKSTSLKADLKPGTYTVICAVPGHEQLGMKMMLTVQ